MRLAFRCVVRNGIRRFQVADPSNDPGRLRRVAAVAREEGVEEIAIALTYSVSAVHTHAYYARARRRAGRLRGDGPALPEGSRRPRHAWTPSASSRLTSCARPASDRSSSTATARSGSPRSSTWRGSAPGFSVLHTAVEPLARGTSNPAAETTLRNLEAEGFSHRLDLDALAAVSAHFRELARAKGLPLGQPQEYDATYYHHQLAGGMVSTTRRMLEELRRPELFDAVLEEVGRVRAEMGYPIIVTPVSQQVATQAVRNVIDEERWSNVSDETIRYFLGHFGEPRRTRGRRRRRARALAAACRRASRARAAAPRRRARAVRAGDLRRGAASAADDAWGAGGRDGRVAAGSGGDAADPAHVAAPRRRRSCTRWRGATSIAHLRVQKGDELVEWRRAT